MPEPENDRMPGGQGRMKDPENDRRLAKNRPEGATGQGAVKNPKKDGRLQVNGGGSKGQGSVVRPNDRRLSVNRNGAKS